MKTHMRNILLLWSFIVLIFLMSTQDASAEITEVYIDRFDIYTIDTISQDMDEPDKIVVDITVLNSVYFDPSSPDDIFTVNLAPGAQNVRLASGTIGEDPNDICSVSGNVITCQDLQICFPIIGCIDKNISRVFIVYELVLDTTTIQQGDATSFSVPYDTGGTGAGSFSLYQVRFDWGDSGLPLSFVSTLGSVSYLDEENGSALMASISYTDGFNLSELLTLDLQVPLVEIVEVDDPLNGLIYPLNSSKTVDSNPINVTLRIYPTNGETMSGDISILDTTFQTEIVRVIEEGVAINEVTEIQLSLPTGGEAWDDDGAAVSNREIVAQFILDNGETHSSFEATYSIKPRPVILVHGLWSNAETWSSYTTFLDELHPNWTAYAIGDGKASGVMDTGIQGDSEHVSNTIEENAKQLETYINEVMTIEGASHVDIVAHSMGGLISRYYVQNLMEFGNTPTVSRLLMLGTPNGGSDCADWLTTVDPLGHYPAMSQLRRDYLSFFNQIIDDSKGVEFSILAGNNFEKPCSLPEGDGVVTVASALAIPIIDNESRTDSFHTGMTGSQQDFTQFVRPRLVQVAPSQTGAGVINLLFDQTKPAAPDSPVMNSSEEVDLLPGQSQIIQLPQIGGTGLNILLTNMLQVDASLLNPDGNVVDTVDGNDGRNSIFASMSDNNLMIGVYTLELSHSGTDTKTIMVTSQVENDPVELVLSVTDTQTNAKRVSVTFEHDEQAIINASVTVQAVDEAGLEATFELYDDGDHDDGAANDGVYSNSFTPSVSDYHLIQVMAEGGEITRMTSQMIFDDIGRNTDNLYLPLVLRN